MNENELRELDAWIASNIFMYYVHFEGRVAYVSQVKEPNWDNRISMLPHYTTDPAAAMMVLEKCCRRQGLVGVAHGRHGGKENWLCGNEIADTLPLAICLFAKQLFSKQP